jgi:GT2 family glycosyltransferase
MISIVTTYYNRRAQFINTLKSLEISKIKDFEVIAVDDCSDEDQTICDLQKQFRFLKTHRIKKEDKWYSNPCVPFNVGFSLSQGDKLIIQNAECLHYSDILLRTNENLDSSNYLSFATFSLDQLETQKINNYLKIEDFIKNFQFTKTKADLDGVNGWYNHGIYKPCGYHFCSAITRKNLIELNGFDELYALGIAYDDNEFLYRVGLKNLRVVFENDCIAIHQYHHPFNYKKQNGASLAERNKNIYYKKTKRCLSYRVNNQNVLSDVK